jgi:hypothetical protein
MRWTRHVEHTREKTNACKSSTGKPECKTALGKTTRRWEYNIKTDLIERGCKDVDWKETGSV